MFIVLNAGNKGRVKIDKINDGAAAYHLFCTRA